DTRFIHDGTEYTLGKVQYNVAMEQWVTSLQWRGTGATNKVESIPLASGVDLVRQYATNLPSLVAVNITTRNSDPTGPENLRLYIIEDFDKTFVEV
ncbi:phage baseplate plug family protein, partial [Klebsiella pneumoniae]